MSNNGDFDEENRKRSSSDEDVHGAKIMKVEDIVIEQQLQKKPEEENMKDDLIKFLNYTVKLSELFCGEFAKLHGLSVGKGILLNGKPDLGIRVLNYLRLHLKNTAFVFPRELLHLSPSKCDKTFQRAVCCEPNVVLFIGMEHADGDVEQIIAREITENSKRAGQLIVLGTTSLLAGVSETLMKSFSVIDLEELTDP